MLVLGTVASCVAFAHVIEAGEIHYDKHGAHESGITPQRAQLVAMLENAKQSSWKENLLNAVDAQQRIMLGGCIENGKEMPAYVRRIKERSEGILQEENVRLERSANSMPTTKFWSG